VDLPIPSWRREVHFHQGKVSLATTFSSSRPSLKSCRYANGS
jgi:hypothetical protein